MSAASLAAAIARAGLGNQPLESIVETFVEGLNRLDVPVVRVFAGMNTLHPLVRFRSLVWDRDRGPTARFEFRHVEADAATLQQSPFSEMLRRGIREQRQRLADDPVSPAPVFDELRQAGMTDWLGYVLPFGALVPNGEGEADADRLGTLWLVTSLSTDRPGGFTPSQIDLLRDLMPSFALAIKGGSLPAVGHGLLAAYLGEDPARRVLAGTVRRGEVAEVEAALFYADLRGFTAIADDLSGAALIGLLDACFDCMVRPVTSRGGEILKFLGDGLLGIFPIRSLATPAAACARALEAAEEALQLMSALAGSEAAAGPRVPGLDVALHVGTVQYGNVGAETRLDFTVVGAAVNEAARIELLCKEVGVNLLASRAFRQAAGAAGGKLVSHGHHRLRGVREATELFGLPEAPP